jgi:SAM-dependent methyltransferase
LGEWGLILLKGLFCIEKIILKKQFLKRIYNEWYNHLKINSGNTDSHKILEIGSGAGFIKEIMPNVLTSDIIKLPTCDTVIDCTNIPFEDNYFDSILMVDVLHHISNVDLFFIQAQRTLKPGGLIVMSEPWNCAWSRFIYKNFHHEPFNVNSDWRIPQKGPLSGANGALPWIVFERDIALFHTKFPKLKLKKLSTILQPDICLAVVCPTNNLSRIFCFLHCQHSTISLPPNTSTCLHTLL